MKSTKTTVLAVALSGIALLGILSFTAAAPQKKGGKKPAVGASKTLIAAGKKVYDGNGCAACHMIGAKGGKTGPEVSHVGKTRKADWLTTQIREPKKNKPEGTMPGYDAEKINAKDIKALVAYLVSLK